MCSSELLGIYQKPHINNNTTRTRFTLIYFSDGLSYAMSRQSIQASRSGLDENAAHDSSAGQGQVIVAYLSRTTSLYNSSGLCCAHCAYSYITKSASNVKFAVMSLPIDGIESFTFIQLSINDDRPYTKLKDIVLSNIYIFRNDHCSCNHRL